MSSNTTHHNVPEYSVSEISYALKQTVEECFSHVRVRGEISGFKRAPSGHAYFTLKDEKSALSGVCWRGTMGKLPFKPEDGLEVICTGKMSTYPGRSNYQLIIDYMEPAGVGALMALLEKRKAQLAKEGLFDADDKLALPFMPRVIGVVTSPTGAVIRDILHRLNERFPTHVLVWPVLVQGEQAAPQIEAAIRGFNNIKATDAVPRPDVLIVARGGGSIEDLWPFNEENVVRAVAESAIPLITAVGHETDTTLVDFASDKRAPTPTAAAEFAVPVRSDLQATLSQLGERLTRALKRNSEQARQQLMRASKLNEAVTRFYDTHTQRLDMLSYRLRPEILRKLERDQSSLQQLSTRLRHPKEWLAMTENRLNHLTQRLNSASAQLTQRKAQQLSMTAGRLNAAHIEKEITHRLQQLNSHSQRLQPSLLRKITQKKQQLSQASRLLDSYHYKKILQRGFALVRDGKQLITEKKLAASATHLNIEFADGTFNLPAGSTPRKRTSSTKPPKSDKQESLF